MALRPDPSRRALRRARRSKCDVERGERDASSLRQLQIGGVIDGEPVSSGKLHQRVLIHVRIDCNRQPLINRGLRGVTVTLYSTTY